MVENKICETIRELRKKRGISQEILAQAFDVSVQAISKWETGNSLPDILLLPAISRFFGISIDELFYGIPEKNPNDAPVIDGIKDDGVLRVVQFLGAKYLGQEEWTKDKYIKLDIRDVKQDFSVEVWGNADIKGDVKGGVHAGVNVNCGGISGGAEAGVAVNCGGISGGATAGVSVNCGGVSGGVNAGNNVNCGNISGGVSAGDNVNCADISGNVETGGDIRCNEIKKADSIECENLYCKGNIKAGTISGEVHHEGNMELDY